MLPEPDTSRAPALLRAETAHSTLATGVHIRGDISATGLFCVCGQITGDIQAPEGTVVVSNGGRVEGNITCLRLEVNGEVRGVCTTGHAEIGATGAVTGGLCYGSLTVHPGGGLCGDVTQQEHPVSGVLRPGKALPQKAVCTPSLVAGGQGKNVSAQEKGKNKTPASV